MMTHFINSHRAKIVTLAARTRLPAIYTSSVWPSEGGLVSYATDRVTQFRGAASYVDRILKVARALRLTIPPSLLAAADHVIDD